MPINLLLLAACLEEAQIPVDVIDANAMGIEDEDLADLCNKKNPIMIGGSAVTELRLW